MIHRAADALLHNRIANHPDVMPTINYSGGYADFSPLLDHPDQYILLHDGEGAASIFEWSAPGVWQGHSMFLPEVRGKQGIEAGKSMVVWMFESGANMIWGQTPIDNRRARMFNRLIGAKSVGTGTHHVAGPVEYFAFYKGN
jgi:hypothetical protein